MHHCWKSSHRRPRWRENLIYKRHRKVFSEHLKQSSDTDEWRSSDDRVFLASGPDVENTRGPSVTVCVLGTTSWVWRWVFPGIHWYHMSVSIVNLYSASSRKPLIHWYILQNVILAALIFVYNNNNNKNSVQKVVDPVGLLSWQYDIVVCSLPPQFICHWKRVGCAAFNFLFCITDRYCT